MKRTFWTLPFLLLCIIACGPTSQKQDTESNSRGSEEEAMEVTPENYARAETDQTFTYYAKLAPINTFFHYKKLTPLDNQGVVRMNRDCVYSGGLIDTKGGATLTVPKMPDNRYMSVMLTDNDMYVPDIYHKAGTYNLPEDTRYLFAVIRIQILDPDDSEELEMVNKLQEQFEIKASSSEPFKAPNWDQASLKTLHDEYNSEFAKYDKYPDEWSGTKEEVDEKSRRLAVAGAWGLFPNKEATYINYDGGNLSGDKCYKATYKIPENNAFWSITVYGKDGKMQNENCILNETNTIKNDDGTFTVHFGSATNCSDDVKNRLDITDGWNFLMRVYRPGESVLNGSYKLPEVEEVR
ncbi:DUF1214 domain-containing protein [Algivirga pacifica]|uniref:DUF1254 domain-containing protein n=1 Tax=Algivirga pacifica TaxID=1162670 RepID=A0ABP9D9P9_9BACT